MSVTIKTQPNTNFIELHLFDRITKDDYEQFLPVIDSEIKKHGRVCMLVVLKDFQGWDIEAGWEETRFVFTHYSRLDRIGIVGASEWQKWMTFFSKPFTSAEVKYFDTNEETKGRQWVTAAETIYVSPEKESKQQQTADMAATAAAMHEVEAQDTKTPAACSDDAKSCNSRQRPHQWVEETDVEEDELELPPPGYQAHEYSEEESRETVGV